MGRERSPVGRAAPAFRTPPGGAFSAAPGVVPERERAGFRGKSGAFLHGSRRITFAVAIVKRPAVTERCRPALLRRFFREERAAEGSSAEKFRCRKILPSEDPTVGRPAGAASSAGQRFRQIRAASSAGRARIFGSAAEHAARSCRVPRSVESYREAGRGATPSEKARRSTARAPPMASGSAAGRGQAFQASALRRVAASVFSTASMACIT